MSDIENPKEYGRSLHFYRLSDHKLYQTINLGDEGKYIVQSRLTRTQSYTYFIVIIGLPSIVDSK